VDAKQLLDFATPSSPNSDAANIAAEQHHLDRFLACQQESDFVVLYGNADDPGSSLYVTFLLIPASEAHLKRRGRFTDWNGGPFDSPSCGLVYGGREGARVEYNESHAHSRDPRFKNGKRLVLGRHFDGSSDAKSYFELHQELTHISKRSYTTDFEGSFDMTPDGLRWLKSTLDDLGRRQPTWFTLHEKTLVGQLHYPLTTSNKTWNDALIGIAKCVVEGLKKSFFETAAKALGRVGEPGWGSLKWVREYLIGKQVDADRIDELVSPLVETQRLRSKLSAHAAGNEAATIRKELLKEFGSPKAHIEDLATKLRESLVALDAISGVA